jgi:hypothetical protein
MLFLVLSLNLTLNHNGVNNMLYAKGKANILRNDSAENYVITNNNDKAIQNQKQVTNKVKKHVLFIHGIGASFIGWRDIPDAPELYCC